MNAIARALEGVTTLLKILGAACLVGMTLLTCVDVVGRYLGHPVFGSVELVGFMATLAAAFALPYTHQMKGHIGVEVLVTHFSERTQTIIDLCTNSVSFLLFAIVTWRMAKYARTIHASGEVSMSLEFPEHIVIFMVAFCFLVFTLMIIKDIVAGIRLLTGKK